jgi:hypothetical protein
MTPTELGGVKLEHVLGDRGAQASPTDLEAGSKLDPHDPGLAMTLEELLLRR